MEPLDLEAGPPPSSPDYTHDGTSAGSPSPPEGSAAAASSSDPTVIPAREAFAELLATVVASGEAHACGGPLIAAIRPRAAAPCLPRIIVGAATEPLSLPLSNAERAALVAASSRSGVGKASSDVPVIDLAARVCWELLPHEFTVANEAAWDAGVLKPLLATIQTRLECPELVVGLHLYKLLLYEPGCFFAKHRDNERIAGMWGTLVVQLPSEYEGALLRIFSPSRPDKCDTYDFSTLLRGGEASRTRSQAQAAERKLLDGLAFAPSTRTPTTTCRR